MYVGAAPLRARVRFALRFEQLVIGRSSGRALGTQERLGSQCVKLDAEKRSCRTNLSQSTLFTLGSDFTIYRQKARRLIPVLAPK
jgi:hypothetical protein